MWECSPIPSPISSVTGPGIKGLGGEQVVFFIHYKKTGWNEGQISPEFTGTVPALHRKLTSPDTRCQKSTFPELSSSPGEKVLLVILNSFMFVKGVGTCI